MLSLRELGRQMAISHSALSRLPRALGLPNYAALQAIFRKGMRFEGSSLNARAKSHRKRRAQVSVESAIHRELASISSGLSADLQARLKEAAQLLLKGSRIWLLGRRSSFGLAYAAWHLLAAMRRDVTLLDVAGGTGVDMLIDAGPEDVLLAIGTNRVAAETLHIAALAKRRGVVVIAIVDDVRSPLIAGARIALVAPGLRDAAMPGFLGAAALIGGLLDEALALREVAQGRRLAAMDRLLLEASEFGEDAI